MKDYNFGSQEPGGSGGTSGKHTTLPVKESKPLVESKLLIEGKLPMEAK